MHEAPGIARGSEANRFCAAVESELGRIAATDNDDARRLQPLRQGAVVIGNEAVEQAAAVGYRHAGVGLVKILQQIRGARQWAGGKAAVDLPLGLLVHAPDDGVDLGIAALDARNGRGKNLAGGDGAPRNQLGEPHHVVALVAEKGHGQTS